MTTLELRDLSRTDLERLVVVQHGRLKRIREAVDDQSKGPYQLRRAILDEIETYDHRTKFAQSAAHDQLQQKVTAGRMDRFWERADGRRP